MSACSSSFPLAQAYAEDHLRRTFYNLTSLAPHNWRAYAEMSALSAHRDGFDAGEDYLPPLEAEQVVADGTKDKFLFPVLIHFI